MEKQLPQEDMLAFVADLRQKYMEANIEMPLITALLAEAIDGWIQQITDYVDEIQEELGVARMAGRVQMNALRVAATERYPSYPLGLLERWLKIASEPHTEEYIERLMKEWDERKKEK